MGMQMSARLAKDGLRYVCGMIDCGTEIARVRPQGGVTLSPGTVRDEMGIWRVSVYAHERQRKGLRPKLRRGFPGIPMFIGEHFIGHPQGRPVCGEVPTKVRCPSCGMINNISAT